MQNIKRPNSKWSREAVLGIFREWHYSWLWLILDIPSVLVRIVLSVTHHLEEELSSWESLWRGPSLALNKTKQSKRSEALLPELPLNLPLELMVPFGSFLWEGHSPEPHCLQQDTDNESLLTPHDFFPLLKWSCQKLHLLQMIRVCYGLDLNCPPGTPVWKACFPESC